MLFFCFLTNLKEEVICLGTFCLSWLQRASEHQTATDFLYHLRSEAQARSKLKSGGVGVLKQNWWLVSQNLCLVVIWIPPRMNHTGGSVVLSHFCK